MDKKFKNNKEFNKFLISDLKKRFAKVKLGGGQKRIDKLHEKGKMTARERIDYLFDNGREEHFMKHEDCFDYLDQLPRGWHLFTTNEDKQ